MIISWLISDLRLRFAEEYRREDYRSAVTYSLRQQQDKRSVLLLCNGSGAQYYGWDEQDNRTFTELPQEIVVSRPKDYEPFLLQIESSGLYEKERLCPGFIVYRRKY